MTEADRTPVRENAHAIDGHPVNLLGPEIRPGDAAPGFEVVGTDMRPWTFADTAGAVRLIMAFPSLDTGVCDTEAREFSRRAGELPGVHLLALSVDLPFAQSRWCGAAGVDNLKLGSDHRELSFGLAYGVVIQGSRQFSRAVFVVWR